MNKDFENDDICIEPEILYNMNLTQAQKIMFGIIQKTAKYKKKGCRLTNKQFATRLGMEERRMSTNIKILKNFGYITIEYEKNTIGRERQIYLDPYYKRQYKKLHQLYRKAFVEDPEDEKALEIFSNRKLLTEFINDYCS